MKHVGSSEGPTLQTVSMYLTWEEGGGGQFHATSQFRKLFLQPNFGCKFPPKLGKFHKLDTFNNEEKVFLK